MQVQTLTISELEHLLEEYPWFTLARKEYVRRRGDMGEDALRQAAAEAGLFLLSRSGFMDELKGRSANVRHQEVRTAATIAEVVPAIEKTADKAEEKPKYYVVNGDYFDKDDYRELEKEGLAFDTSALVFNPIASAISSMEEMPAAVLSQADCNCGDEDDSFCTETLAKIYLEQEFYQRAIDIYEKLILLYPKKSAYFATLIEQAKNIKQ